MRSWSQPTESTCRLGCSGEVKRLWVVVRCLKSQSFLSPNRVWILPLTLAVGCDRPHHCIDRVLTHKEMLRTIVEDL